MCGSCAYLFFLTIGVGISMPIWQTSVSLLAHSVHHRVKVSQVPDIFQKGAD